MRKLIAGLVLGLLMVLPVATVYASAPPEPVSGEFTVSILAPPSFQKRGAVCMIGIDAIFHLDGAFTGDADMHLDVVHKGECFEPATEVFRAKGTYTGAVEAGGVDVEGTFDFTFQGTIDADGHAEGRLIINSGTGGLANLQGTLLLAGTAGVDGDYSGKVHFAP